MVEMHAHAVLSLFAILIGLAAAQLCDNPDVQLTLAFCAVVEQGQQCANQIATEATCDLCQTYIASCGPLELNNEALCSDPVTVLVCQSATDQNVLNCTGDRSVDSYLCDQCDILITNCPLPPSTGVFNLNTTNVSSCDDSTLQFYCAIADIHQACPGRYTEDICGFCGAWPVLCGGPPQLPDSNNTCAEDFVTACLAAEIFNSECTNLGVNPNPDVALECDVCAVINEQCESPSDSYGICNDTEISVFCATAFSEQLCPGTTFDNVTCNFCSFAQTVCGPLYHYGGVDDFCSNTVIRNDCFDPELASVCAMEVIPPDNITYCDVCNFLNEACVQTSASGSLDQPCNDTKLVAFCATTLSEDLCLGTKFNEETCNTCFSLEDYCGPLEGDIEDFCEEENDCLEIAQVCSMDTNNIPQENITLCDVCGFLDEWCPKDEDNSGHSTYDVALMSVVLATLLQVCHHHKAICYYPNSWLCDNVAPEGKKEWCT